MMNRNLIAERLKELRDDRTQQEIASAIGVSVSTIGMYELGERIPKDSIKIKLAQFFNVNVNEIFFDIKCHR